ncbi:ligand-binding sensor domain-containing protein [Silvibacterium acidisoli]|uniref:ligand-binding sensor domain-containing protein n=1 Tax=Acidobacteriaceae bacterium ZG23-2 TaxID=2883246 RepID=UPI00406BF159
MGIWKPGIASAQFSFARWTVENGLPQNEIEGMAQTPDGYLWIVTMDGLARFDGVRFTILNKSNTPEITSNRFVGSYSSSNGDLWLRTEHGGLLRYRSGVFHAYGVSEGLPKTPIGAITGDSNGEIWILSKGSILKWDKELNRFDPVPSLNSREYSLLAWDAGGMGAYDKNNVYTFCAGILRTYSLPERLRGTGIAKLAVDQDQVVWIETGTGEHVRLAIDAPDRSLELPKTDNVVFQGPNGQHWSMNVGPGLLRSIEGNLDGKPLQVAFYKAFTDRQGSLWLGTPNDGLYRLQRSTIDVYTVEQGLTSRNVYPIYQDRSGAVWIGAWEGGLSRRDHDHFTNYTMKDGLPSTLVTAIFQDTSGRLWIGSHGGLTIFDNGRFLPTPFPVLPDVVQAIHEDSKGDLWFGMRSGLVRWSQGELHTFTQADGMPASDVHVITESKDGDIWIGSSAGLTRFHQGVFHHWTQQDGLSGNDIWSLYAETDGTLWIGTFDSGLMKLKDGKITRYTTRDGLFNDGVFAIVDDQKGYLWISCDMGIYRLSKRELAEFADGSRSSISSTAFGKADGLLDLECNGGITPAGMRSRDGSLWFATQDGAAVIRPSQIPDNLQPSPVVIETALVGQRAVSVLSPVVVPPSKDSLEVQYTAPSFYKPEQIRFRYRLEGLDTDWVNAGLRRSAFYTHIPPGVYRFQVSSEHGNGIWSPVGEGLPVTVLAPFYRTLWFECLVLFGAIAILTLLWQRRMSRLRYEQAQKLNFLQSLIASQEDERKRIAGELHDSLGQRLVVINAVAQLSLQSRGKQLEQEEMGALQEISSEALAAIEDTRTISYDLRPVHLDRFGLTRAIEILVRNVSSASSVPMTAEIENIDDLLPEEHRINLYRIVQEALSNIVKYAEATAVSVRAVRAAQQAILTVEDNGVGFETAANANKTGRHGLGLRGMSERATLIGGEFTVTSAPGHGTTLRVLIPTQTGEPDG